MSGRFVHYTAVGTRGVEPGRWIQAIRAVIGELDPQSAPADPDQLFDGNVVELEPDEVWVEFGVRDERTAEGLAQAFAQALGEKVQVWFTRVPHQFEIDEDDLQAPIPGASRTCARISADGHIDRSVFLTPGSEDGEPLRPRGDAWETARAALWDAFHSEDRERARHWIRGTIPRFEAPAGAQLPRRLQALLEATLSAASFKAEPAPSFGAGKVAVHLVGADGSKRMSVLKDSEWQELSRVLAEHGRA